MWKLFKKLSFANKYGVPFLLGVIMLTHAFRESVFMMKYHEVIGELVMIFCCFIFFFEAFRRNKCMWQVASILGVVLYCILNIIYYTNGKNEKILDYQSTAFWLSCSVVVFYIIKDTYDKRNN